MSNGVLLTGHLPWWAQKQTPHYLAELLCASVNVAYIEPPIAWNPGTPSFSWPRFAKLFSPSVRRVNERLWTVTPKTFPLGSTARIAAANRRLLEIAVRRLISELHITTPYLWLAETENSRHLIDLLPTAPSIFHAIDHFTDPAQVSRAAAVARHADVVLGSTPSIASTFAAYGLKTHVFRNGWEFSGRGACPAIAPELGTIPGPRVGLIGYLSTNLDYELLERMMEALPVSLILIGRKIGRLGADEERLRRLQRHPRVFSLGERPTADLPSYIAGFDVCIAPYKRTPRIYASDPLKVYQYLSSGKPVVTAPVEVLEPLQPLLTIGRTTGEFIDSVAAALNGPQDQTIGERRRQAAETMRWQERWKEMSAVLSLYPRLEDLAGAN